MHWVSKWMGSPTTLGPSPGSQYSHWFPWGNDLPGQGQASDRNELCRLLNIFGTIFCDSLHISTYLHHPITYFYMQCKEMLYGLFSLQTNFASPYTINLMYYDTMVLITKNYLSHQTSELGTSYCKCQADLM